MNENFFTRMVSGNSDTSSKRVLAFMFSIFAMLAGSYIVVMYKEYALTVFGYTLILVGLLLSVATVPEVIALIRGTNTPKVDKEEKSIESKE